LSYGPTAPARAIPGREAGPRSCVWVKNRELWQELLEEASRHAIEWVKVTGHAGVELNERVDRLACAERDRRAERANESVARR